MAIHLDPLPSPRRKTQFRLAAVILGLSLGALASAGFLKLRATVFSLDAMALSL